MLVVQLGPCRCWATLLLAVHASPRVSPCMRSSCSASRRRCTRSRRRRTCGRGADLCENLWRDAASSTQHRPARVDNLQGEHSAREGSGTV